MGRHEDARIARLEDIAAYISAMRESVYILRKRQRGNLRRADLEELARFDAAYAAALARLTEERRSAPAIVAGAAEPAGRVGERRQ